MVQVDQIPIGLYAGFWQRVKILPGLANLVSPVRRERLRPEGRDHHGSVACSRPSSGYAHQGTEWDEHFQVRAEGNHDPSVAAFHVREENDGTSATTFQMRAEGNQAVR